MKYKLSIKKQAGFEYFLHGDILGIIGPLDQPYGDILFEEPTDETIIEYDIPDKEKYYGITRCYREDGEVICNLTLFVEDLEPYKNYAVKDGKPNSTVSKWDFTKLMTAEEVINGNPPMEVSDV